MFSNLSILDSYHGLFVSQNEIRSLVNSDNFWFWAHRLSQIYQLSTTEIPPENSSFIDSAQRSSGSQSPCAFIPLGDDEFCEDIFDTNLNEEYGHLLSIPEHSFRSEFNPVSVNTSSSPPDPPPTLTFPLPNPHPCPPLSQRIERPHSQPSTDGPSMTPAAAQEPPPRASFRPGTPYSPVRHPTLRRYAFVGETPEDSEAMYEYKLKLCPLQGPHDWTLCRYAHEGEIARRWPLPRPRGPCHISIFRYICLSI